MAKYKDKEKATGPKARNDAYVMMLFITLVAIITGTVLMYLDNEEYGKTALPKDVVATPPRLGEGGPPPPGGPGGPPPEAPKVDPKDTKGME